MASRRKKVQSRSIEEKLRGLANVKLADINLYKQKELAQMLGIGERTLRRFKNQAGYKLSPKTLAKIHDVVTREDRNLSRKIKSGTAVRITTKKIKGRRRSVPELVKGVKGVPSRINQIPVVYPARGGASETIQYNVSGWTLEEKIELLVNAYHQGDFSSWHARVDLRQYLIEKLLEEYGDLEEIPEDELAGAKQFIMIGPFELYRLNRKGKLVQNPSALRVIENKMRYYNDAGRVVVEISMVRPIR